MTEMNEAEVLAKEAETAFVMGSGGTWDDAIRADCNERGVTRNLHDVAQAVAAKAREMDAARGGTLSVENMRWFKEWGKELSERDTALSASKVQSTGQHLLELLESHAAQGRTIAAKDARIAELKTKLAEWGAKDGNSPGYNREKAATYGRKAQEFRERAEAAESALATLRQAVGSIIPAIRRGLGKDNGSSTFPLTAARGEWEAILDAMSTTPAEHPDTATLRAIRERAKNTDALWDAFRIGRTDADGVHEVVRHLLGDSGPSGGGELCEPEDNDHRWANDEDGVCLCGAQTRKRIADAVLTPTTPPDMHALANVSESIGRPDLAVAFRNHPAVRHTTPPDVAASEHPVAIAAREAMQRGGEKWAAGGMDGEPAPTPEEDWRTVEDWIPVAPDELTAALTRLKDAPRRAAEETRDRCAAAAEKVRAESVLDANTARGTGREDLGECYDREAKAAKHIRDNIRALEVTP